MKKLILNPIAIRVLYSLMGGFLFLVPTVLILDKYSDERELSQAQILTLQSCYFSLNQKSELGQEDATEFCKRYSNDYSETFASIQDQSNKILDKKHHFKFWVK